MNELRASNTCCALALSVLLLACDAIAAPSAAASAVQDGTPSKIANRNGLYGLISALDDVDRIEFSRWDKPTPPEVLSPEDRKKLLKLVRRGATMFSHTLAHPPWPAVFVFHTKTHGAYAVTIVGAHNLRLDAGAPHARFTGSAARWNDSMPPEMALNDEDRWVWNYFESRLGETKEKEYLSAPPREAGEIEMPKRP